MTTKTEIKDKDAYRCDDCGMHYRRKKVAEQCEKYCRENGICNSEITEKSIERSKK